MACRFTTPFVQSEQFDAYFIMQAFSAWRRTVETSADDYFSTA